MTYASVRAAAEHAVRQGKLTPHQLAALTTLDQSLSDQQRQQFTDLWRAAGSPAQPPQELQQPPLWMKPALTIVKEFEGLSLTAYPDPGTGGDPWTIGYGHTGPGVAQGVTITQAQADELLRADLERFGAGVLRLLPMATGWRPEQQAALISFAFNVGLGALEGSTLRKRLLGGGKAEVVIAEEIPRWINKGTPVEAGLRRRRAAEVALFRGPQQGPGAGKPSGSYLRLTCTGRRDSRGLEVLKLACLREGKEVGMISVCSGAPGAQLFRTGAASKAGSLEPLPEGRYRIEDIAWAGGRDNWTASWGPGLGPVSVPLEYVEPGRTQRSAIEIHIDWNHQVAPGTAGCVGVRTVADMRVLVGWLRETDPRNLYVDWGLGTCPKP